jgi:hypothetical protein
LPNVFGSGFSWYQDKPSDDPMQAKKIPDSRDSPDSLDQNPQAPQVAVPSVSWQAASNQNAGISQSRAGKANSGNALWLLIAVALLAAALFAFFA